MCHHACTASFMFETLGMGAQLNLSSEFDSCLQPVKDGTPNGTVCRSNGWVEYTHPLVSLIMAYIIIGVTDSINISITSRLVCWLVGMTSPCSPALASMRSSMSTRSLSSFLITEMMIDHRMF